MKVFGLLVMGMALAQAAPALAAERDSIRCVAKVVFANPDLEEAKSAYVTDQLVIIENEPRAGTELPKFRLVFEPETERALLEAPGANFVRQNFLQATLKRGQAISWRVFDGFGGSEGSITCKRSGNARQTARVRGLRCEGMRRLVDLRRDDFRTVRWAGGLFTPAVREDNGLLSLLMGEVSDHVLDHFALALEPGQTFKLVQQQSFSPELKSLTCTGLR